MSSFRREFSEKVSDIVLNYDYIVIDRKINKLLENEFEAFLLQPFYYNQFRYNIIILMRDLLNIKYLKENHRRIYYFGLGFIQVVLNDTERIHFYTDELPTTNEDIHTHRYNFKSTILKGQFRNIKYKLVEGETHVLKNESCSLERELTNNISISVGVEVTDISDYKKGDSYNMFYNELHNVSYKGNTITFLERSDIITDYAQVVFKSNNEEVCPFSTKVDEDRLWDIIERVIES